MHSVEFYPLGNADSALINLEAGRILLFDYADRRDSANRADKRIALGDTLRARLKAAHRNDLDVVAFTHLDDDHIHGATEFFHLDHSTAYQSKGRVTIKELWVPAAVIIEDAADLSDEARIIQREARYRLKRGTGIRIFSRPDALTEWLGTQGLRLADCVALITDAGQLVPGFDKHIDGVSFFVHSPFAERHEDALFDRNTCSLVLQATFLAGAQETRLLLAADSPAEILAELIDITKFHGNEIYLQWDIFKLPHHCSYLSLNDDKGKEITEPLSQIAWLFEEQGAEGGIIVSTSDPIPTVDTAQPPHRQAANYYKQVCASQARAFKVTMEHPTAHQPEPLVITIGSDGASVKKRVTTAAAAITSRPAPRAG